MEEEELDAPGAPAAVAASNNPLRRVGSVGQAVGTTVRGYQSVPVGFRPSVLSRTTSATQEARRARLRGLGAGPDGFVPDTIPAGSPAGENEVDVALFELEGIDGYSLSTPGVHYHEPTQQLYRLVGVLDETSDCFVRLRAIDDVVPSAVHLAESMHALEAAQNENSVTLAEVLQSLPDVIDDSSDLFHGYFSQGATTIKDMKTPFETEQEAADHLAGMRGDYVAYTTVVDGTIHRKVVRDAAGIPKRSKLEHYRVSELVFLSRHASAEVVGLHRHVPKYTRSDTYAERFKTDLSKHKNLVIACYAKHLVENEDKIVSHLDPGMIPAAGNHLVGSTVNASCGFIGASHVTFRQIAALTNAVMFGTHDRLTSSWHSKYEAGHLGCEGDPFCDCVLYTHVTFVTTALNNGDHKKCPGFVVLIQPGGNCRCFKLCQCDIDPDENLAQQFCMKLKVIAQESEVPFFWIGGKK